MNRAYEIAQLEARIERLRAQPELTYHCAACGFSEEQLDEPLTDVTVIIAGGEEGYSNITLLLCGTDLAGTARALSKLGFIDHRHGSTSTLEDDSCPGFNNMEACPTPTHYGNVTWGRVPPQNEEER